MTISASDITRLRTATGAGMLDCKKALDEAGGNFDKAVDILRKKGIAKAAKRADRVAAEGVVASYIHGQGKIGVLLEVNCETDFVARTESFQILVKDIAMHIVAAAPFFVSRDEVPTSILEREKEVYRGQLLQEGKAADMVDKIVMGKINKYYSEVCLLDQAFIRDETKTVQALLTEKMVEMGEKITVRRFVRYELGEGIQKKQSDFAAEVGGQLGV